MKKQQLIMVKAALGRVLSEMEKDETVTYIDTLKSLVTNEQFPIEISAKLMLAAEITVPKESFNEVWYHLLNKCGNTRYSNIWEIYFKLKTS